MAMVMPKGPFCQSCAMPMEKPEDFGAEADGAASKDYCRYCYAAGKFTEPDITMEQMTVKVVNYVTEHKLMPAFMARAMISGFIPKLKRWRKT